jgi:ABC-type Fe3+-hydroxamate transport system substrate-binding protein
MIISDQLGNILKLNNTPKRIVSLVPSQTEYLYDIGLRDEVVGITKFCIHPTEWFTTKQRIGGTKKINIEAVRLLQPDLIIANKEENTKEDIELLQQEFPTWVSDIHDVDTAIEMMMDIGKMVNRVRESKEITNSIIQSFSTIQELKKHTVIYLIWKNPYMCAGISTFIDVMLTYAGFENCVKKNRYPDITVEEIKKLKPSVLLLSSEPFPFKEIHIQELRNELPNTKIKIVDGELFSWYGSRMLQAIPYFKKLHEEVS